MMPRILVVDDEPTVRAMVVRAVQADGYDVVPVADGAAGIEAATRGTFDLVVTNDCMPRMNRDKLAVRLPQLCPNLPILYISGRPPDAEEDTVPSAHYLYKPFGPGALQPAVRAFLAHRTRQQAPD